MFRHNTLFTFWVPTWQRHATPTQTVNSMNSTPNTSHPADASPIAARSVQAAAGYAGNVTPQLACQWWQAGEAVLVDIRSDAEREWVGFVPGAVPLAWKQWPGMVMNPSFDTDLLAAVPAGQKVVLLCRSGVRSIAAAKRATELGLLAYNILEGFEGDPDAHGQRGRLGGWRFHGLPWRQN
jgi:sulfur dioxygenase